MPTCNTVYYEPYTVKKGYRFPVPSRDVTKQTLPGRDNLGRVGLVTSRLETGKTITFLQCTCRSVPLGLQDPFTLYSTRTSAPSTPT